MIKAVIFDLDDTLVSEYDYVKSGYKCVARRLAVQKIFPATFDEIYRVLLDLFAEDSKNVFNRLYDYFEIPYSKKEIKELVNVYREHKPDRNLL